MNGLAEFAVAAVAIFAAITALLILLPYLEASLSQPEHRRRQRHPRFRRRRPAVTDQEPTLPSD